MAIYGQIIFNNNNHSDLDVKITINDNKYQCQHAMDLFVANQCTCLKKTKCYVKHDREIMLSLYLHLMYLF